MRRMHMEATMPNKHSSSENTVGNTDVQSKGGADTGTPADCAAPPVLVTRDETNTKTQSSSHENIYEGEKVFFKRGRGGAARLIFQPIPNKSKSKYLAHIDWLAFTIPQGEDRDWRWLRQALDDIFDIPLEAWKGTNHKWSGYTHRVNLIQPLDRGETINLGLVAYGGEHQRGTMHVSLNGQACARIHDWQLIHDWGETVNATITRIDTAHDDFEGKTVNIDIALDWHKKKLFSFTGRPSNAQLIDDLGSGNGKTLYIGKRANGKLTRIYEKGKEQGDPLSPWVRVETEWRNQSRVIPWDIVINPGHYLAGAYPCLEYLSIKQVKIKTIQRAGAINYDAMVKWLKTVAGKSLNAMLQVEHGDVDAVIKQIVREGLPKRLEPFAGLSDVINRDEHENVKP